MSAIWWRPPSPRQCARKVLEADAERSGVHFEPKQTIVEQVHLANVNRAANHDPFTTRPSLTCHPILQLESCSNRLRNNRGQHHCAVAPHPGLSTPAPRDDPRRQTQVQAHDPTKRRPLSHGGSETRRRFDISKQQDDRRGLHRPRRHSAIPREQATTSHLPTHHPAPPQRRVASSERGHIQADTERHTRTTPMSPPSEMPNGISATVASGRSAGSVDGPCGMNRRQRRE